MVVVLVGEGRVVKFLLVQLRLEDNRCSDTRIQVLEKICVFYNTDTKRSVQQQNG